MARDRGFEFLGVPYAIPPVGSNKAKHAGENVDYTWMPGTPPFRLEHCWKNVLKYPKSKPQECLQIRPLADGHFETYGSQDCLTLDIYSPYVGYDTPSPVVVVIAVPTLFGGWIDQAHQGNHLP
jgi:carboxylesterase type B